MEAQDKALTDYENMIMDLVEQNADLQLHIEKLEKQLRTKKRNHDAFRAQHAEFDRSDDTHIPQAQPNASVNHFELSFQKQCSVGKRLKVQNGSCSHYDF